MAVLNEKNKDKTGFTIETMQPEGDHIAVCLFVRDRFRVDRQVWQAPEGTTVKRDVSRFLFGFLVDKKPYLIQTFEFLNSSDSKSNLMQCLTSWLGHKPPEMFDYSTLTGKGIMLSVSILEGKSYPRITGFSPVHKDLLDKVPNPLLFKELVELVCEPDEIHKTALPMEEKTEMVF